MPPASHFLYRNNGDGTFTDVSREAGISELRESYGMTVVSADFDEDGWPDIFVACDSTPSLLLMNNHDGIFREEGVSRGVALSDDGSEQAGMGVGVGDYNLDGRLDLFKTNVSDDACGLYRNDGKANFEDVTLSARIGVETRFTGWGCRDRRPGQRRHAGAFYGDRHRISRSRGKAAAISLQTPR